MQIDKLEKKHEGTYIYLFGYGNVAKEHKNRLIKVLVKKVNRVHVTLMDGDEEIKVTRQGRGEANYDFNMYERASHFQAELAKPIIAKAIIERNKGYTEEQILSVMEILGLDVNLEKYLRE